MFLLQWESECRAREDEEEALHDGWAAAVPLENSPQLPLPQLLGDEEQGGKVSSDDKGLGFV